MQAENGTPQHQTVRTKHANIVRELDLGFGIAHEPWSVGVHSIDPRPCYPTVSSLRACLLTYRMSGLYFRPGEIHKHQIVGILSAKRAKQVMIFLNPSLYTKSDVTGSSTKTRDNYQVAQITVKYALQNFIITPRYLNTTTPTNNTSSSQERKQAS